MRLVPSATTYHLFHIRPEVPDNGIAYSVVLRSPPY